MASHTSRRAFAVLLWVAAFAQVVQSTTVSEILTSIPKCALPCVIDDLSAAKCSMTNVTSLSGCVCQNTNLLSSLSQCIQTSCNYSDQLLASGTASSLCAAYPIVSRTRDIQIASIVTMALVVPTVLARCAARLQFTKKLWLDDWTALLGMVLLAALSVIEYISSKLGFGKHYWNVKASDGPTLLQLFYSAQIVYIAIQLLAKISISLMFIRLFPARWIRITLKIFITFMLTHGLAFTMVIVFQCWPIYSIWDKTVTGQCVDVTLVGYIGSGLSIGEDIFLILLPLAELRKLQVSKRQRVLLSFMFAIASFAAVTSMIRFKYILTFANTFDSTWDNVDVIIWSLIELLTAVFLGSLPPLRPWLIKLVPRVTFSWTKTHTNRSNPEVPSSDNNESGYGEVKSKPSCPESMAVYDEPPNPPPYREHKKSSSYTMSAISSLRNSDYCGMVPDSPLLAPTSRFHDYAVAPPESVHMRWSGQPDSPTDPNMLAKSTSLYLNRIASLDLESNYSRDTWTTLGQNTWTQLAVERLSSKFAGPRAQSRSISCT